MESGTITVRKARGHIGIQSTMTLAPTFRADLMKILRAFDRFHGLPRKIKITFEKRGRVGLRRQD